MTTLQFIIACGIISVIVSVLSILVSTSYGCDWLIDGWNRWTKPAARPKKPGN